MCRMTMIGSTGFTAALCADCGGSPNERTGGNPIVPFEPAGRTQSATANIFVAECGDEVCPARGMPRDRTSDA
jgi:hypothetical protein